MGLSALFNTVEFDELIMIILTFIIAFFRLFSSQKYKKTSPIIKTVGRTKQRTTEFQNKNGASVSYNTR